MRFTVGVLIGVLVSMCGYFSFIHSTSGPWNEDQPTHLMDLNGVPYYNYKTRDGIKTGLQRNPLFICTQANKYHGAIKKGDTSKVAPFLACLAYLDHNLQIENETASFIYHFPLRAYDLWPGWQSALANSRGLETYVRAYQYTKNSAYLDKAKYLLNMINLPVAEGGVKITLGNGDIWFEEYPKDGEHTMVLNGMISVVRSVNKYAKYTNDSLAKEMAKKGFESIEHNILKYEGDQISYYDILKKPASISYHEMHIGQLDYLYKETGVELFKTTMEKWQAQLERIHS